MYLSLKNFGRKAFAPQELLSVQYMFTPKKIPFNNMGFTPKEFAPQELLSVQYMFTPKKIPFNNMGFTPKEFHSFCPLTLKNSTVFILTNSTTLHC